MNKDENIKKLDRLIENSAKISGVKIDNNKQILTYGNYLDEILSLYSLESSELANLRICYDEGKTVSQTISRLSDIRLGYI